MKTYKWESLTWNEVKPNVFRTRIDLLPMQKLHVEEGWEISGPIRVSFRWDKAKRHTRVWYKPLPKKLLDLDGIWGGTTLSERISMQRARGMKTRSVISVIPDTKPHPTRSDNE